MGNLEALASRETVRAWLRRGLGYPSVLDKENVREAAWTRTINACPNFHEWNKGRQVRYLQAAVRNNAHDQADKEHTRRRNWERMCSEMQMMEKRQATVEEIAEARIALRQIRESLELMSEKNQTVVHMLFTGMTVKEIASTLRLSEDCLETSIRRLKSKLRSCIE